MPNVVRYHFTDSKFDRARFIAAVLKMKTILVPGFPSLYDKYIDWHLIAGPVGSVAHRGLAFLAWHRAFLWEFEKDLQFADTQVSNSNDGRIGVPYWDWTKDNSSKGSEGKKGTKSYKPGDLAGQMWDEEFLGPNGTGLAGRVLKGPFVNTKWPAETNVISNGNTLPDGTPLNFLRRELGRGALASKAAVLYAIGLPNFDVKPFNENVMDTSFRNVLEGWAERNNHTLSLHNAAHNWIGGNMLSLSSPYEPAFWLNHSNVDRIWAIWQVKHPRQTDQWPLDNSIKQIPLDITTAGTGYRNGVYRNVPLIGGFGLEAKANITVVGGEVKAATVIDGGYYYEVGDKLKARPSDLGGSAPIIEMVLTIPINGTINDFDSAYPPPMSRPANVVKLDEPMFPWNGTLGTRIWTPRKVLAWQSMGPAGEHQYRYDTDPPSSFRFE